MPFFFSIFEQAFLHGEMPINIINQEVIHNLQK